jgi:predicted GIY-YIG superfamily endonuclease
VCEVSVPMRPADVPVAVVDAAIDQCVAEVCGWGGACPGCGLPCEERYPIDPTNVYRMYNRYGCLLYVGMTRNAGERFEAHASSKSWWIEVAHIDVSHHVTREMARVAELVAIRTEHPMYNKADRRPKVIRGRDDWKYETVE